MNFKLCITWKLEIEKNHMLRKINRGGKMKNEKVVLMNGGSIIRYIPEMMFKKMSI